MTCRTTVRRRKREVELEARDVEVREALELALDLREAVGDLPGDLLLLVHRREQALLVLLEVVDLLEQVADGPVARELGLAARVFSASSLSS